MDAINHPFYTIPQSVASGRIKQLFEYANLDAADPNCGARLEDISKAPETATEGTLIYQFIQKNKDLYNKFLNNSFCRGMALGTLPVSAYQEFAKACPFAKQDYLYLLDNVRFKALRFAKLDPVTPFDDLRIQSQKIARAVDIAEDWKRMCVDALGIPDSAMENIEPSAAEIGYASFLESQAIIDDWFSLYIITIPCIYGWGQIAKRLDEDPQTDRSTTFYKTFIKANLNDEFGKKLCQFIEANRGFWSSTANENVWNALFRTALKFEIGLFESVLIETPDFRVPPAAIHGNCVFSNADQPVEIRHLSGQAVVGPTKGSMQGKIHFPLGPIPYMNMAISIQGWMINSSVWLQVDCSQSMLPRQLAMTADNQGGSQQYAAAKIVKAEVFIGCSCIASKRFIPPKTQSFKEMIDGLESKWVGMAYESKGWEVTLTLEFERSCMRFCSVAVSFTP